MKITSEPKIVVELNYEEKMTLEALCNLSNYLEVSEGNVVTPLHPEYKLLLNLLGEGLKKL